MRPAHSSLTDEPSSPGARRTRRLRDSSLSASVLLIVLYTLLQAMIHVYSIGFLDGAGQREFWTGRTRLGLSLLAASRAIAILLGLLVVVEAGRAWRRRERPPLKAFAACLVALLLLGGLFSYFESIAQYVAQPSG
jgi:hypothetical protein